MIDRTESLELAAEQALSPQGVEKDYVLGWLLRGIFAHPKLAENWIFDKGDGIVRSRNLDRDDPLRNIG